MKYQFCIRFKNIDANSAASKAVIDCNSIFSANGYEDYTFTVGDNSKKFKYYILLLKELSSFFLNIKPNSIIGIQYPLLSINSVFKYFIKVARLKKVKVFCIIHDLESLRIGGKDQAIIAQEINNLNFYDQIIVHNEFMQAWLSQAGVTKPMETLELFDYLTDDFKVPGATNNTMDVAYAGNLTKSTFIYNLHKITNAQFKLYGPGYKRNDTTNSNIQWDGEYSPEQIPKKLKGDFGLIWDGNSIEKCDEKLGNYLKFNNPHKCSLYIAAGLPIIAPRDSAIGAFIIKHQIGILIENLYGLEDLSDSIESYKAMKQNVLKLRQSVIIGEFFTKAIKKVEFNFLQLTTEVASNSK